MIRLILIRNAETKQNKKSTVQSQKQGCLSQTGIKQAKLLKKSLKDIEYNKVISSSLDRATQTATHAGITQKIIPFNEIKERNYGEMTDFSYLDIVNLKPNFKPKNGESTIDLIKRAEHFLKHITTKMKEKTILAFTHHDFILSCLHSILNQPIKNYRKITISNASITELIYQNKSWAIKRVNDISYLGKLDTTKKYD